MFCMFIAFTVFANFDIYSLHIAGLLAFLEFMVFSKFSPSAIANHISAVKSKFSFYDLNTTPFLDPRVKYFCRSLTRTGSFNPSFKSIIDIPLLTDMAKVCDTMYMGQVFKAEYLLSFFLLFVYITPGPPHNDLL